MLKITLLIALFLADILWAQDENVVRGNIRLSAKTLMQPSVTQSKEALTKLFKKIDDNSDKIIMLEELIKWIELTNEKKAEADAKFHLKQFDSDKDNAISWKEYLEGYYGNITLEFASNSSDHREVVQLIEEEKMRFNIADKDKDGKLNVRELKAFYNPSFYPEMIEYEVYKTLQDYDVDNDEKMSRDEYIVTNYGTRNISPQKLEVVSRVFDLYDLDKDAALDGDEIAKWLLPDVIGYSKIEAEELLKKSDTNKDGKLELTEILDNLGHWIHSKATNYGHHILDEL